MYLALTETGPLTLLMHQRDPEAPSAVELVPAQGQPLTESDFLQWLGRVENGELVGGYLAGQLGDEKTLHEALSSGLPQFGVRMIEPLAARMRAVGVERLALVPCGLLALVPLHAAAYGRQGDSSCLLDEFDISCAPSARALIAARAMLRERDERGRDRLTLAGVANPLPNDRPLRYASFELEAIASKFAHPRHQYGHDASRQWLNGNAVAAAYVHLACHGVFNVEHPLDSKLELANNETLSLRDILTHRPFPQARLIVASACQTALTT